MNKMLNTVLFLAAATLVNIIILLLLLTFGIIIIGALNSGGVMSEGIARILYLLVLIGSLAGAFLIYNRIVKAISRKMDMEKYFAPIFPPKKQE